MSGNIIRNGCIKISILDSIKGKNVVITGASTGLGEQLAYQYARLGANIVITAMQDCP